MNDPAASGRVILKLKNKEPINFLPKKDIGNDRLIFLVLCL